MIRKLAVVLVATLVASFALTVDSNEGSEAQNINLTTVKISPTKGAPGTLISTTVSPGEAQGVCLDNQEAQQQLVGFGTSLLANPLFLTGGLGAVLGSLNSGVLHSVAPLYAVAFADIATQQPISQNLPGWDPISGNGSIVAPNADKPKAYAVAVVCLGLRAPDPAAAAAALAGITAPDAALEALLRASINDDPIGTGFGIFCLTDGPDCGAASPVVAGARTAG